MGKPTTRARNQTTRREEITPPTAQPGPQEELLKCPIQDVFFGGAKGGGKTYGLCLNFLSRAQVYGPAAIGILFRKTYNELEEVIRASKEILYPAGWTFTKKPPTWTSPEGATFSLRYLEADEDVEKYQGFSFTDIDFDEAGNWSTPTAIDRMWGMLRSPRGVPCIRRLTGNPGGPGHTWLKKRYIDPAPPLTPFKWLPNEKRPDVQIESVFIPSRLEDNPILFRNDPGYEARIFSVGTDALARAWRYGDWSVVTGQYFDIWDPEKFTVTNWRPEAWNKVWMSGDWGFEDPSVIHWHAIDDRDNVVTFHELYTNHKTAEELGRLIGVHSTGVHPGSFPFAPDAFSRKDSPRTVGEELGVVLRGLGLPFPYRADNDRVGGWQLMYQMLKSGMWKIDKSCEHLIASLPRLQRDEKNLEDIAESPVDHAPDSARYGLKSFIGKVRKPIDMAVADTVREGLGDATPGINDLIFIARRAELRLQKHRFPLQRRRYRVLGH